MKYLMLSLVIIFLFCGEDPVTGQEKETISFLAEAGTTFIEDIEVQVYNKLFVLRIGELPFTLTAHEGDTLTAYFEVDVSNFAINHPQCDCEVNGYYHKCTEDFIVNGETWKIAEW